MTARLRLGCALVLAGSALGAVAGVVQATVGARIPAWTGAKADPVPLGLLTVVLAAGAALGAALLARAPGRTAGPGSAPAAPPLASVAAIVLVGVAAVVGCTTVGRLWYPPGALLVVGLGLAVEGWATIAASARGHGGRVLLAALGGCLVLMALRGPAGVFVLGVAGGVALVAAAVLGPRHRTAAIGLVAAGVVPFAVLTWSALVPVLVALVAVPLALADLRPRAADAPGAAAVAGAAP